MCVCVCVCVCVFVCLWLTEKTGEWKEVGPFPRKGHIIVQQNVKADFPAKRDFLLRIESVWNKFKSINTRLGSSIFRRLNREKGLEVACKTNLGNGQTCFKNSLWKGDKNGHTKTQIFWCSYLWLSKTSGSKLTKKFTCNS
jgi:hypothetical protein